MKVEKDKDIAVRIAELQRSINTAVQEIGRMKKALTEKEATIFSMRGGIIELQRLLKPVEETKESEE